MTVGKFLSQPCIKQCFDENPDAAVWVYTRKRSHYRPCTNVVYDFPDTYDCGYDDEGDFFYKVKDLVEELERAFKDGPITILGDLQAAPYIIKNVEEFVQHYQTFHTKPVTVDYIEKRIGKLKYPIIVIDKE